jgi:hypothetical protein
VAEVRAVSLSVARSLVTVRSEVAGAGGPWSPPHSTNDETAPGSPPGPGQAQRPADQAAASLRVRGQDTRVPRLPMYSPDLALPPCSDTATARAPVWLPVANGHGAQLPRPVAFVRLMTLPSSVWTPAQSWRRSPRAAASAGPGGDHSRSVPTGVLWFTSVRAGFGQCLVWTRECPSGNRRREVSFARSSAH